MGYNGAHWEAPVGNPPNRSTIQYDLGRFTSAICTSTETNNSGAGWNVCANNIWWIEANSHPCQQPPMSDRVIVRLYYPACAGLPGVAELISGDPNVPGRWDTIIDWGLGQGVTDFQILNEIDTEYGPFSPNGNCHLYSLELLSDYMAGLGSRFKEYYGPRGARAGFPGPAKITATDNGKWRNFWDAAGPQWGLAMNQVAQSYYDWVAVHVYPAENDWLASLKRWTSAICNAIYNNEVPGKDQRITEYGIPKDQSGITGSQLGTTYADYVNYVHSTFPFVRSTHVYILADSDAASQDGIDGRYELTDQECSCMASILGCH